MTTDQEAAEVNLVGFLENFTVKQDEGAEPKRRIGCLHLYRHYLLHCQEFGVPMAHKAQFAAAVLWVHDVLPDPQPTGEGQVEQFFDGIIFTGSEVKRLLAILTPEMQALLREPSALDTVSQQQNGPGDRHRAR